MNHYSTAARPPLATVKKTPAMHPETLDCFYDANLSTVEIKLVGLLGSFDLTRVCIFQI